MNQKANNYRYTESFICRKKYEEIIKELQPFTFINNDNINNTSLFNVFLINIKKYIHTHANVEKMYQKMKMFYA